MARISDCFVALFAAVVIGRSNYVGVGFPTAFENRSPTKIPKHERSHDLLGS